MMPSNTTEYHNEGKGVDMIVDLGINESPINLFNVDLKAFPSAKHINRHYA